MAEFRLHSRIEEHESPGHFVARVRAIPVNVEERVAPEELVSVCRSRNHARLAVRRLERQLEYVIRARGNRLAIAAEHGI